MSLEEIRNIPVESITPNRFQPRVDFQEDSLKDLAASIQSVGLIHPISVRATDATGRHEHIAG
ncbi:MAG: ParB N-terminal domain-containing protein, partial [Acidiferrobacteraceae bacterium]